MGAMLCWMIWKYRNDLVWNRTCLEVTEAMFSARVALNQWKAVQDKSFDRSWCLLNAYDGAELWTPSTENQIKINTGDVVYETSNRYTYAFAARNHKG